MNPQPSGDLLMETSAYHVEAKKSRRPAPGIDSHLYPAARSETTRLPFGLLLNDDSVSL